MLGVVPFREVAVDPQQLERYQVQTATLETRDQLADEATLHAVGLDEDQGPLGTHSAEV